ncbi:MAG: N-acetylmuramoyl-L-alanine amidase [Proteobacteria bacterium]|nr:N-acetylmuramoyl-L-alanine amidase [Pseudomonadota bacterium]
MREFSKNVILKKMSQALFLLILLLPLLCAQGADSATRSNVTSIRHWSNPTYTRIVIDLDKKSTFKSHLLRKDPSLKKPRRFYVDINDALLGKIPKSIEINDGLLKTARTGQYNSKTVRVVLDIESIDDYKVFALSNPYRIVIDVSGKGTLKKRAVVPPAKTFIRPLTKTTVIKKAPKKRRLTIVIDPGHGGRDPGATGRRGLKEKDVTLKIAKMLRDSLKKRTKARVVMTRTRDVYVPLEERTAIANREEADLFISIHVNASRKRKATGIESYILNVSEDAESKRLAARENSTTISELSDLEFILSDLVSKAKTNDSVVLANIVHTSLIKTVKKKYRGIKSNGVKQAPFYVLVGTRMPAVLMELSFISNARDEKRLKSSKYLATLVQGISDGVVKYVDGA